MPRHTIEIRCPTCGKTRLVAKTPGERCRSCSVFVRAWGVSGLAELKQVATQPSPLHPSTLDTLLRELKGLSKPGNAAINSLKRTLRMLGYKGKFVRRNHSSFSRWAAPSVPDDGQCAHCGTTENLQMHHVVPLSWGGDITDPRNLMVLCAKCHKMEHRRINRRIEGRYGSVLAFRNLRMKEHAEEFRELIK